MTLSVLPKDAKSGDSATVAFLTPKRLGGATLRNKLRRRMREIYRRHLAPIGPGEMYLIWIARPPASELDFTQLRECMRELQARLRPSA